MSPVEPRSMSRTVAAAHRRPAMLKMVAPLFDIRTAVAHLTEEILNPRVAVDAAAALDHLRTRIHAVSARLWVYDGSRVTCALDAGAADDAPHPAPIEFADAAPIIQRLRHTGAVVCRRGDVSGLEALVPGGVQSFVAAAASRGDTVGAVLVAGWALPAPPINDEAAAAHLRIAAAVLAGGLRGFAPADERASMSDAILDSLPERIAVVDRHGVVSAVNAAWQEFRRQHGTSMPCTALPGMSDAPACTQSGTEGSDPGAISEGIRGACTRGQQFSTAITCGSRIDEHWCLLSVTPLNRREGGAVVTLTELSHGVVVDMARGMTGRQFRQLADTVPLPLWILSPDGRLLYGNERWAEACGGLTNDKAEWTDAFHPEDRDRAVAEFTAAVQQGHRFQLELRLRTAEGTYRWAVCSAAPRYIEGRLDSYVGVCWDAAAKRRAESTLAQVAGKLVVAQEEERSRIARELHDDVGQQVAVLTARLSSLTKDRPRSQRVIMEAYKTAQEIATTIHALSHELHPAKLRLLGLVRTLDALCRDESEGTKVKVTFAAREVPRHLHESTALTLFRVAQEALHNALKHSGATTVVVALAATSSALELRVTDNGNGLDPMAVPSAGLGLFTMRERVELAGGTLAVEQARPRGTTIRATVPLVVNAAGATPSPQALPTMPPADVPVLAKRHASRPPAQRSTT